MNTLVRITLATLMLPPLFLLLYFLFPNLNGLLIVIAFYLGTIFVILWLAIRRIRIAKEGVKRIPASSSRNSRSIKSGFKTLIRALYIIYMAIGLSCIGTFVIGIVSYSNGTTEDSSNLEFVEANITPSPPFANIPPLDWEANIHFTKSTFATADCSFIDEFETDISASNKGSKLSCGYVDVPLYYEHPEGPKIEIPIGVYRAENDIDADPVFFVQGGPGASGLDLYPHLLEDSSLQDDMDLVIVDARGTRYAKPALICPENLDVSKLVEEGISEEHAQTKMCSDYFESHGVDLSAFTSSQLAGDVDAVRQALGYDKINFYGVSYGAVIGQYLLAYYPDSLRSVILDGVPLVPLDYQNNLLQSHTRVFEKLFEACKLDSHCYKMYPDLEDRMISVIEEYNEQPTYFSKSELFKLKSIPGNFNGETFLIFTLMNFYLDDSPYIVPYLISQAEHQRIDYFKVLWDLVWRPSSEGRSDGLHNSIKCAEHLPLGIVTADQEGIGYWLFQLEGGDDQNPTQECAMWSVEPPERLLNEPVQSDVPTLLLSGYFDPVTPPEYAERVSEHLQNSFHIIDPIGAHGVAFSNECMKGIVSTFLAGPRDEPDTSCLTRPERYPEYVPPNAIQAMFLGRIYGNWDLLYLPTRMSGVLLGMILGFAGLDFGRIFWIRRRRGIDYAWGNDDRVWSVFLMVFLSFILLSLMYSVGLAVLVDRTKDLHPIYLQAVALPVNARGLLMLPLLLPLILFVLILLGVFVRKREGSWWLRHMAVILTCSFCAVFIGFLIWTGMMRLFI